MQRFTHAVIAQIPSSIKCEDKKTKVDVTVLQKQQEDLAETLRQAGVHVVQVPREKGCHSTSLLVNDGAIVINGTALLCRPKKHGPCTKELLAILQPFVDQVSECPEKESGKAVVLEASDVLYTGSEIFVGTRKHGTNMEGGMVVARTFGDIPVVQIPLPNQHPLKYYISLAAKGVLSCASTSESQAVLRKIEHEATFRYKTITVDDEGSVACMLVNDRLVVRQDKPEPKFSALKNAGLELWALDVSELSKVAQPFTRYCLLFKQTSRA